MSFDEAVFDEVAAVADAVLFEGYLLYPYRASAQKNVLRWQFGVLTPAAEAAEPDTAAGEPSRNRTECLLEPGSASVLRLRLRFLRLQQRQPVLPDGTPVPELAGHTAFEEGIPVHVDAELPLTELLAGGCTVPVALPATETVEDLGPGRLVRTSWEIRGRVLVSLSDLPGPYLVHRLRFDVVNDGTCPPHVPRAEVLRTSLIAAHTVVHAPGATFVSPVDHPRWAEPMVRECTCEHSWPVLAGPEGRADLLLSSPIILHDHAQIAPESPTNLFDGLENDEILTLRTLTLTDAEKAEARATDPRAAGIIDSIEEMPPEILERLHGAIRSLRPATRADEIPTWGTSRPFGNGIGGGIGADSPEVAPPESTPWWDPGADASVDPDTDRVLVAGVPVAKGSRVVLRPRRSGSRGTDAQDRFLDGLTATVHAVVHDVDGGVHVAVSVDGDPAAELQLAHGRFRYFRPDELEPLS
jgi:hypothetical protein